MSTSSNSRGRGLERTSGLARTTDVGRTRARPTSLAVSHSCRPYVKSPVRRPGRRGRLQGAQAAWNLPELCSAYQWPSKLAGRGTIGLIELGGGWSPTDVQKFFGAYGQPIPTISDLSVDGTQNAPGQGDPIADQEVALDLQVAAAAFYAATSCAATVRIYWCLSIANAIRAATRDGCDVCSVSWGKDEALWSRAEQLDLEAAARAATDAGMVVMAASGDNDSSDGGPTPANVDLPASAPHVIGCGGTTKTRSGEIVWNSDPGESSGNGTGGGYSTVFPSPAWQASVPGGPGRMVPDVAANADPDTGYTVVVGGAWTTLGGTSAVAPLYAGLIAACGSRVGFVAPALYRNPSSFADITQGDNGVYRASTGPDPCTGLGAPIGTSIASLLAHPRLR